MLAFATQVNLRASGNLEASKLVHELTTASPSRASKYIQSFHESKVTKMSNEEALVVLIEAQLTRHQYNVVKNPLQKYFLHTLVFNLQRSNVILELRAFIFSKT